LVLAIGLVVSGISFFLNDKGFYFIGPYSLFLYFGLLILLYGFISTLIWFMNRKSPEEIKEEVKKNIAQKETEEKKQESAFDKAQKTDFDEDRYRIVVRCKRCGMPHYIYANFCSNCGAQLEKK
jgi:hypothetical protein